MSEKLLDVKNLHTSFFTHLGEVQASVMSVLD